MPRWPEKTQEAATPTPQAEKPPAALPAPNPDPTRPDASAQTEVLTPARETYWGPRVEPIPHFKKAKK